MQIILSDIDGVYDRNPKLDPNAKLLPVIENITEEIIDGAEGASKLGQAACFQNLTRLGLVYYPVYP